MYAIIATGGKQYKVEEGDVLKVEKLGIGAGESVTFDQVLAVSDGEMKVGTPVLAGVTVSATVLEEGKGKKIIVYRYKRKSGYHKKKGHRQPYTMVRITGITYDTDDGLAGNVDGEDEDLAGAAYEENEELVIGTHDGNEELTSDAHDGNEELTSDAHDGNEELTSDAHDQDNDLQA